jgi:hypothetical protein
MTYPHNEALLRHFADLRDRWHGETAVTREEKEQLFAVTVEPLDPIAREALDELNEDLLLGTGKVAATGLDRTPDGGLAALWVLWWPEQVAAGINPIAIRAHYGRGFHHPHEAYFVRLMKLSTAAANSAGLSSCRKCAAPVRVTCG